MKVFVAANTGSPGTTPRFGMAVDGEFVWVLPNVPPCSACGCVVTVLGVASGYPTSRFRVEDRPGLAAAEYMEFLRERWHRTARKRGLIDNLARIQMEAAARFPAGREFNLHEPLDRAIALSFL
jgi:hypothetical protein